MFNNLMNHLIYYAVLLWWSPMLFLGFYAWHHLPHTEWYFYPTLITVVIINLVVASYATFLLFADTRK